MQNLKTRLFKTICGWIIVFIVLFGIFVIINLIPTKHNYVDRPEMPQMFKKLAEFKEYSSYFIAQSSNLNRIDVLFKNQALESKEKLNVQIFDDDNRVIFNQNYDSGNFGDTNRVRMDFTTIHDSKNRHFKVVITPLEIVDWKMYFGVKGDDIDLVQYFEYEPSFKNAVDTSFALLNNWVFVLPFITVVLFLW